MNTTTEVVIYFGLSYDSNSWPVRGQGETVLWTVARKQTLESCAFKEVFSGSPKVSRVPHHDLQIYQLCSTVNKIVQGANMSSGVAAREVGERHLFNMTGFSTLESSEGEERVYYFGDDPKGWNFRTEVRGTIVDLVRGKEPTTVLGALIKQSQLAETEGQESITITMEALAERVGRTVSATEAIVDYLAEEELAITVTDEEGTEQAMAAAFYTTKNETALPSANESLAPRALSR